MKKKENWIIRLRMLKGEEEFTFAETRVIIGRGPNCELCLPYCKLINREHAEIYFRDGRWYIADRMAMNGTWLNGVRLESGGESPLNPGDLIGLAGQRSIVFVEGRTPEEALSAAESDEGIPPAGGKGFLSRIRAFLGRKA